ncbi:serine/threonine protein kinase [Tundrisphaera lichenicola]|uniref:serine/threonine protein kinase n=1 Tax=Tundrisphaera lichenicola TaxID=2029860 RepID=UPI003EB6CC36
MIGQKLGSFRIEAELGSGAMGVVYRGVQEGKERKVAIKVIAADQIGKGKAFQRFEREAEILEQFRHPNIVRYIARGRSAGTYYYAMEYVSGPTLDKVLRDKGVFPWRKVAELGVQLCDALQYAHDRGVFHRDLKPSNLMLNDRGQLKLADFGIAKVLDRTALTGTGRTLGTAAYMAPEQIRGTPEISHKTDLYALGAVFYQMLTGDTPFSGSSAVVMMHMHINEPPPRPSRKVEEIPKALDDLVVSLMAKSPTDRPWDATAVGQILRGLLEKANKKVSIPMVWPEPGTAASMPQRAEILTDSVGPRPTRIKKKIKQSRFGIRLETIGLLAGLVLVSGTIAYLAWPPGANYLYRKAESLMASDDPLDWVRARDEYLDPLETRFPLHAYKEQTEAWRDRLDLRDIQRRAEILEKPNLAAFSKPKNEAEALYVHTFEEATAAVKRHHDGDAEVLWRDMAKQLTGEGRENRGWILLAQSRADELATAIRLRRETVIGLLEKAAIPDQLANNETAQKYAREILNDILTRFDAYPEVADLCTRAKLELSILNGDEGKVSTVPEPEVKKLKDSPKP